MSMKPAILEMIDTLVAESMRYQYGHAPNVLCLSRLAKIEFAQSLERYLIPEVTGDNTYQGMKIIDLPVEGYVVQVGAVYEAVKWGTGWIMKETT